MSKVHLTLRHSESVVASAAATIYAAYIASGKVSDGDEEDWMERSLQEAIRLARRADQMVVSDEEMS